MSDDRRIELFEPILVLNEKSMRAYLVADVLEALYSKNEYMCYI
jgi:hypothetical protein